MEDMLKDMDFSHICSQIQELLIVNEEVVLPGLGKFIIESTPATFKEDGMSILPPGKKLSFVQGSEEVECVEWQKDLSGKILDGLALEGKFEVSGFGIFTSNEAGKVSFTADEEFDFAPDNFSLEAISLEVNEPPVVRSVEKPVEKPIEKPIGQPVEKRSDVPMSMDEKRKIQKWMIWIAVAVILLLVLVLFVVLFKDDFMELVKRILYSKEELEIMQKWAAQ